MILILFFIILKSAPQEYNQKSHALRLTGLNTTLWDFRYLIPKIAPFRHALLHIIPKYDNHVKMIFCKFDIFLKIRILPP